MGGRPPRPTLFSKGSFNIALSSLSDKRKGWRHIPVLRDRPAMTCQRRWPAPRSEQPGNPWQNVCQPASRLGPQPARWKPCFLRPGLQRTPPLLTRCPPGSGSMSAGLKVAGLFSWGLLDCSRAGWPQRGPNIVFPSR